MNELSFKVLTLQRLDFLLITYYSDTLHIIQIQMPKTENETDSSHEPPGNHLRGEWYTECEESLQIATSEQRWVHSIKISLRVWVVLHTII